MQLTEKQKSEGWRIVKFGDIAKSVSKRVDPSETELEVYVGLEHLDPDNLRITRRGVPSDVKGQKLLVKPGQIIFGKRRAYQRKVAIADFEGICSAHAMVLEAIPEAVIPEYLPFFIQSDMFMERAVAISEGSLSPTIKWKTLANQEFPLPPRPRQEEMLEVLNSFYNAEIKNLNAISSYKRLYINIRYNLMNKGTKIFSTNSENTWSETKFENIAFLQRGFDLPEQNREEGSVPIYASTSIVGHHKEHMIEGPGVVTGRSGTIGQVAYIEENYWPLNTALFVKDFKGNNPRFVKYFIENFRLERFASGSGVPTLNRNDVHRVMVKAPELSEQIVIKDLLDLVVKEGEALNDNYTKILKAKSKFMTNLLEGTA